MQSISCFTYHRFGDDRYPSTNISLEVFESQLAYLKRQGYQGLTLGEALEKLKSGEGVPERAVVLTVDDGYQSFANKALPLLREYGYPATLFVQTDSIGDPGYMGWKELRRIRGEDVEIANHSASHAHFLNKPDSERINAFKQDVLRAQQAFEKELGHRPELFSYPYGEYTPAMQKALREMGFSAAAAQKSGVIHSGGDRFALPRFPMGGPYANLDGFASKAKMLPLRIQKQEPSTPFLRKNPPSLRLHLETKGVDLSGLQCFVAGKRECAIDRDSDNPARITVKAKRELTQRRTLYTITAPSEETKAWHWFSHLWVRSDIQE